MAIGISDTMQVGLLGLATTSSVIIGAALGLHVNISRKLLACILAFAAGSLIAALAIELGFEGAHALARHGAAIHLAWSLIAGGFGAGAIVYYVATLFLESKGSALRYPSRFMEYALNQAQVREREAPPAGAMQPATAPSRRAD